MTPLYRARKSDGRWFIRAFALLLIGVPAVAQQANVSAPLTADEVMGRVVAMNEVRAKALESYSSVRSYRLECHCLSHKQADMTVRVEYRAPDKKTFTIVSESGSGSVRSKVFKKLLDAEQESMREDNQRSSAISPENYAFELVDYGRAEGNEFYVLDAEPKAKNKFLFRGKIWVDGTEFAITRVQGQPAVNPSWWTLKTDFKRSYQKVGEFWLPESNESETKVRVFGTADLCIEYGQYEKAERAGHMVEAYLLYSRAAALDPTNQFYRIKSEAVQARAALESPPHPTPPSNSKTDPVTGAVTTFDSVTAKDLAAEREMQPPVELKAAPGLKDFDLTGDAKSLWEQVTHAFALDCVFDGDYQAGPRLRFQLAGVDYRDAIRGLERPRWRSPGRRRSTTHQLAGRSAAEDGEGETFLPREEWANRGPRRACPAGWSAQGKKVEPASLRLRRSRRSRPSARSSHGEAMWSARRTASSGEDVADVERRAQEVRLSRRRKGNGGG